MQAIVLVGGKGTRLRPLTETIPKPALTLVDRPFLAYMIEWLAAHGADDVILACGFLPDVLREALAGEEERAGARIRYVAEPEPLGTAGAIRFAAEQAGDIAETFLALNGDVLTDLDLTRLMAAHRDGRAATIALHQVDDSSAYGVVRTGADGEVLDFVEKTGEAVPGEVNAGMYVLDRSVLDLIPSGRAVSIEREVFPRLAGNGLYGVGLEGYWMDIGTPERYLQASWDILERRVETRVEATAPGLLVSADAEVAADATVGPRAVVGPGCRVGAGARISESVLLERASVGEGAKVERSILSRGAAVAPHAEVTNAVAGSDERVPA